MIEADVAYFQTRFEQELQRSKSAKVAEVALAHKRMAESYEAVLVSAKNGLPRQTSFIM